MTRAGTSTTAGTYARQSLIRLQVSIALQETGAMSKKSCDRLLYGISEKWIEYVRIYGLDARGDAHAELRLGIDWQRHEMHVSAGRINVSVGRSRFADSKSVVLRECIDIFNEYVTENSLMVKMHASYRDHLSTGRDEMNARLGLVAAVKPRFVGATIGEDMTDPDIDEFSAGVYLAEGGR